MPDCFSSHAAQQTATFLFRKLVLKRKRKQFESTSDNFEKNPAKLVPTRNSSRLSKRM